MANKYLDENGLLYLWQKIKSYFTGTATPTMNGTAAVGTSAKFAREDHVHPVDTSRAPTSHATSATTYGKGTNANYGHVKLSDSTSSTTAASSGGTAATPKAVKDALDAAKTYADGKITGVSDVQVDGTSVVSGGVASIDLSGKVDVVSGKGLSTNDYTTTEKNKLAGIEEGAEVNTIESISVNGTPITPDATGNVAITVAGGVGTFNDMAGAIDFDYAIEHQNGNLAEVTEELYLNISVSNGTDEDVYSEEIPVVTTAGNGLMSKADKIKLNGIATGAEVNCIESITVNNIGQAISNKNVDISVPTKVSDLTNDSGFVTTDTKNTAGSTDSSSKLYLIGATSQAANPQTYSQDTAYVGTDGHLYSNNLQVVNLSGSQALTNKTYNGYTLAAACAKGVDTSIASGSTSTNVPTSAAVAAAISAAQVGAATFQGTVNAPADISGLTAYKKGWYWVVATADTYAGKVCEVGDMIFAIADRGSSTANSDFSVVQSNLDLAAITNSEIDTIMAS